VISFRNKADVGPSVAIILAILVMIGTLVFVLLPKPKVAMTKRAIDKVALDSRLNIKKAKEAAERDEAFVAQYVWTGPASQVAPVALARATKLSADHHVKLVAFRPQRPTDADGFTQLPFQISVEGPFPAVAAMLKELETPQGQLCVNLVQVSAAEGDTDKVSATIGTIAFLKPTPVTTTTTTTTTEAKPEKAATPAAKTTPAKDKRP
jgi:hypothetical protein